MAALHQGNMLVGAAGIVGGAAVIGVGVAVLRDSYMLLGAAGIGAGVGVAAIGVGVAALRNSDMVLGAAFIGAGIAIIGFGVAALREAGVVGRVGSRLIALTREPPPNPVPHRLGADTGPVSDRDTPSR